MGWSDKYKKSIDCDNPKGFSQRAHCQGRKKKLKEQLKPFKTVEQIAKKHRMEVSFIQKQLDMGEPIEHEHTKNHTLAKEIALQHLDEIPDYYTRLKKMEASAKKEHKKFKDVTEERSGSLHQWFKGSKSKEGKPGWVQADGSPCANEPGETKTPKCFSSARLSSLRAKGKKGEAIIKAAVRRKRQEDPGQQAKSGSAKPTLVKTFAKGKKDPNYIKPEPGLNETMEINEAQRDIKGKGSGKKDACYHKVKSRYDVWPSAYASGALVKCRKVGAASWGTKSEETVIDEGQKCWPGYKKKGTKKMFGKTYNNCVKANEEMEMRRYCPKCEKTETRAECKYGPKYWDMFSIPEPLSPNQKKYSIATVHPGNFPESYDHEYSMARSEISTIISAAKRLRKKMKGEGNIEAWVQSKITKAADYLDAAADYVDSGEMQKEQISFEIGAGHRQAQKMAKIRNLATGNTNSGEKAAAERKLQGPKLPLADEYHLKSFSQFMEDWQSVNRKDKTDGLSQKAVDAYRRENPGSKLQTAVTEKNPTGKRAGRRKNFCSRMKGMKSKLTSAKTARDPDSRINKALRRWNCN
jgi:hypothetical protein